MEIKVSELTGFCFGVKQAVDLSMDTLSKKKKVFSVGPIIHNPQVVKKLKESGLTPVDNVRSLKEGTVIISSHGAGAKLKDKKNKSNLRVIDATCPFVKRIQRHVKTLYRDGYRVIIIGKKMHPEVKALLDFTDGKGMVIKDAREAERIDLNGSKIGVVSQSTYSQSAFLEIVSILLQKPFLELRIFNTICKDTIKRQNIARRLANDVDVMIIIGGRDSANTRRLAEICRESKRKVHYIEESSEIDPSWLKDRNSVGIASGASTPDWVVKDVIKKIEGSLRLLKVT